MSESVATPLRPPGGPKRGRAGVYEFRGAVYYGPKMAADYLGVSKSVFNRLRRQNPLQLPLYRLRGETVFLRADLDAVRIAHLQPVLQAHRADEQAAALADETEGKESAPGGSGEDRAGGVRESRRDPPIPAS